MNAKERSLNERRRRNHVFFIFLGLFVILMSVFFVYEIRNVLLPILVGAILAYLFRPVKKWFQVRFLPHEVSVILAVAISVAAISVAVNRIREMIPDEKQKLELKVRLKYKLNERYQEFLGNTENPVLLTVKREVQPVMSQLNDFLSLDDKERDLFKKYRRGYRGEPPISDHYFEYFKKNIKQDAMDAEVTPETNKEEEVRESNQHSLIETLSLWIICPLVFIFLIFDNGQIRVSAVGMVPNRYFEMALVMLDDLDEAIGKYLRGTFLECSLVGGTMGFGLLLLGFPLSVSLFVAVVSGLANAIPFLGTVIGLIISLSYALIAEDTVPLIPGLAANGLPIYVAILVGITHVLDNAIYSPIVLGGAVNLHPLVVIIAIAGGSMMLGLWGMLLAIPTVVVLKTGVETLVKQLKAYRII